MAGITLLTPGQCGGEDDCYPCEGTCCDQGDVTSVTLANGTNCWAVANGTFGLISGVAICTWEYTETFSTPTDPCVSGFCREIDQGSYSEYWHISEFRIIAAPSSTSQSLTITIRIRWRVWTDFGGGCSEVGAPFPDMTATFTRTTCQTGTFTRTLANATGFGTPPDITAVVF